MGWLKRWKKQLCPYCFEYFDLGKAPFRCMADSPGDCPGMAVDPVLRGKWGETRPTGAVVPSRSRFADSARCSHCDSQAKTRICPECHSELPNEYGSHESLIVAVIGAKNAGKSHYIAVLIDELRNKVAPALSFPLVLEGGDQYTTDRYRLEFHKPLYERGQQLDSTRPSKVDRNMMRPLVYSLSEGRSISGGFKKVIWLAFFDTAGEQLDSVKRLALENKYIYRSAGVILLVDPLQIPQVRDKLSGVPLPARGTQSIDVLENTIQLIQLGLGLGKSEKISIPLAVAFTKFDALDEIVDAQLQLRSSPVHSTGFDWDDFIAVSEEMEQLLERWGHRDFVHIVKQRFQRCGFFGLSALGGSPNPDGLIKAIKPRRVADPLLWILQENRIIGTRRRK